ncbi:16492_t:CDS:2 [Funneliformis geosporum]|nr:16492_t:CDS:2 [Funneliformis geosporum]
MDDEDKPTVRNVTNDQSDSLLTGSQLATSVFELASSTVIPFTQFMPLIKDVSEILNKVTELYRTAQHNKNITKILTERIAAAYSSVCILQTREDLFTSKNYSSLQRLVHVLQKMKKFVEEITQYNTVQKFLGAKLIEKHFEDLCKEYDSSISLLNFTLTVGFQFHAEKEKKIVKADVKELLMFQEALAESMDNLTNISKQLDKKVSQTNDKMNSVVERVSEMSITMESLINEKKGVNQTKIDNIFQESLLPLNNYYATKESRGDKLRKYTDNTTMVELAFKTIDEKHYNQVKNQVTIFKQLKDCQNIIHFYGITSNGLNNDKRKYYLVTEWAEHKNLREYISLHGQNIETKLRLRFAYDIAKGLNFLNSVKIVHRDIRSENIVITEHQIAKITNFKLSRGINDASVNLAVDRDCARYSSPEMIRRELAGEDTDEKQKYDTKCEVYSFGILLWEIAECKIPYEQFDDFMEISKNVLDGYRELFNNHDIPDKYQNLVHDAVDPNPGLRPMFSKMLIDLKDVFKNGHSNGRKPIPVRKMSGTEMIDWSSFNYLSIDKAVEEHMKNNMEKQILYRCFDAYANLDNPKAKYYKAYYISKGWSDLTCSQNEKDAIAVELFKEAADYGEDFPEAQLRYATMVMNGKGVKKNIKEAVNYLLKAAKNDNVVAMFSVSTYYFSQGQKELGNFYLIKAANRKHDGAIKFCKTNNITY